MCKLKIFLAMTGLLTLLALPACGKKGPLYLPEDAPAQPAPAPADTP